MRSRKSGRIFRFSGNAPLNRYQTEEAIPIPPIVKVPWRPLSPDIARSLGTVLQSRKPPNRFVDTLKYISIYLQRIEEVAACFTDLNKGGMETLFTLMEILKEHLIIRYLGYSMFCTDKKCKCTVVCWVMGWGDWCGVRWGAKILTLLVLIFLN